MSEKQKQVLNNLESLLPGMSDTEMARLVGYGEGLAARNDRQEEGKPEDTKAALAGCADAV